MKRIAVALLIALCGTVSAGAYDGKVFHDAVYRGEKWNFDFGIPENRAVIILPGDGEEPRLYGSGERKAYGIILLGK